MKKGDIVSIYERPLTETKFEGKAKLVKFLCQTGNVGVEYWRARFVDDNFVADRAIKVNG